MTTGRADREAGSGTVLVLTAASVLILAGMLLAALAAVGVARHRAASVADLSALAAASSAHLGSGPACDVARELADRSAARLLECVVVGDVADVVAAVRPQGRLGELGMATARARAGPASSGEEATGGRSRSSQRGRVEPSISRVRLPATPAAPAPAPT